MSSLSVNAFQPQSVTIMQNGAAPTSTADPFKKGGFGFGDLIDTLNPLHHIPIVGQVYRAITGDQISDTARMAGGGLFAGPLGIGIAAATISLRDGGSADEALVETPEPSPQAPDQPARTQAMGVYDTIAQGYWTQSNLQALAQSFGLSAPDKAPNPASDDAPDIAPHSVPDVSAPETLAPPSALPPASPEVNNAIFAQMLANLEKLDASGDAPR